MGGSNHPGGGVCCSHTDIGNPPVRSNDIPHGMTGTPATGTSTSPHLVMVGPRPIPWKIGITNSSPSPCPCDGNATRICDKHLPSDRKRCELGYHTRITPPPLGAPLGIVPYFGALTTAPTYNKPQMFEGVIATHRGGSSSL